MRIENVREGDDSSRGDGLKMWQKKKKKKAKGLLGLEQKGRGNLPPALKAVF